jgi:branched-chain amino acid transport system permease protein
LSVRTAFTTQPSATGRRLRRIFLVLGALALLVVLLMPLTSTDQAQAANVPLLTNRLWFRLATNMAMFVVLASAWNLMGGLTGYAAFGNVAFFGIGAYTADMLIGKAHWAFLLALFPAPLAAAVFAVLIGLPLLRLRGHYFAVASLGVGVAVGELIKNLDYFGGATGLFIPIFQFNTDLVFFYLMVGAAGISVGVTWLILRTRFGYGLLG